MLRGIRKASENWLGRTVMGVVMTLLAGSFAVWGINDIFSGFGRSSLAKIGATEISIDQFRQTYQRPAAADRDARSAIRCRRNRPSALGLDRQVLGEMIAQAGLDQRATPDGARHFRCRNRAAHHYRSEPADHERPVRPPPLPGGAAQYGLHRTALRRRRNGRPCCAGRSSIRVSGGLTPPKAWLDAINQYQNEERSIEYVALGPAQAGDIAAPTADALSKYYDDAQVAVPRAGIPQDRRACGHAGGTARSGWKFPTTDVKNAYDERLASFTTPERRHVEQIVFPIAADAQAADDQHQKRHHFRGSAAERGLKEQDTDLGTVAKSALSTRPSPTPPSRSRRAKSARRSRASSAP